MRKKRALYKSLWLNFDENLMMCPFKVLNDQVISRFSNMLHFDAMALGNHEFDDGISGLGEQIISLRKLT